MQTSWHLYIIRTDSGALYTGISTDVDKRLETHLQGQGSKFLRAQRGLKLVYQCEIGNRSLASKAEYQLKQRTKSEKEKIIAEAINGEQLQILLGISPQSD